MGGQGAARELQIVVAAPVKKKRNSAVVCQLLKRTVDCLLSAFFSFSPGSETLFSSSFYSRYYCCRVGTTYLFKVSCESLFFFLLQSSKLFFASLSVLKSSKNENELYLCSSVFGMKRIRVSRERKHLFLLYVSRSTNRVFGGSLKGKKRVAPFASLFLIVFLPTFPSIISLL